MSAESEKSPETPDEAESPLGESPLTAAPKALQAALQKRGFDNLTPVQESVANADDVSAVSDAVGAPVRSASAS